MARPWYSRSPKVCYINCHLRPLVHRNVPRESVLAIGRHKVGNVQMRDQRGGA